MLPCRDQAKEGGIPNFFFIREKDYIIFGLCGRMSGDLLLLVGPTAKILASKNKGVTGGLLINGLAHPIGV